MTSTTSEQPSQLSVIGWILGSIGSSVGLILINKLIMHNFEFKYVFTLTALHFAVTTIGMEVMALMNFFTRGRLPFREIVIMAIFCIGSVAFMNFSLQYNSVGFYQVLKLLCIPCMVVIQTYFYGQFFTNKVKLTLFIVLLGVGIATVTDMELNAFGCFVGALAVLFTTVFQIWQGEKQKQHKLNAMQMNHSQALPSFLLCASLALIFECNGTDSKTNVTLHTFQESEGMYIFISCVLALSVNLCTYGLIGKTSAVTYQVVGHAKTCFIMIGGLIMYPINDTEMLMKNLFGITVAMVGVIVYGHLRTLDAMNPRPTDWLDTILPAFVLNWLEPNRARGYEQVSEQEMEKLNQPGATTASAAAAEKV